MLEYLHVKNLALIKECEIDFKNGLNILTGETGAGKSVLMGSVTLCLGKKADKSMIRHGENEALVELEFRGDKNTLARLEAMDLPCDDDTVLILRKITPDKSIFKINGETVTARQVKEITEGLIDIHGQAEHQTLLNNTKQRELIDRFGGESIEGLLSEISDCVKAYREAEDELDELLSKSEGSEREMSLLEYEIKEIEDAALYEGEDTEVEERYKLMKASEKINAELSEAMACISQGLEGDAGSLVSRAISRMQHITFIDESTSEMLDKLTEAEELLGDFALMASRYADSLSFDPAEMDETEHRLDLINTLKSKFGNSVSEILSYHDEKLTELDKLKNLDSLINELKSRKESLLNSYKELAAGLSKARAASAKDFSTRLIEGLSELNFEGIQFEVLINSSDAVSQYGSDTVEFMLSTNPGEPVKPMKDVASGGELSRVMLAVKTIMADKDETETLIFDEIDAGISGRTAWEVSKKLARISKSRQVISITHLAQIAAMADTHFEISKKVNDGVTETKINELDSEGEIMELSRLLGAGNVSDAVTANARELKAEAESQKQRYRE